MTYLRYYFSTCMQVIKKNHELRQTSKKMRLQEYETRLLTTQPTTMLAEK
jgi:hypothetical protein